jgi:hypothetical protein
VKGLAALSVIFALIALILIYISADAKTEAPVRAGTVFAGLWAMSISVVLHNLLSK